ncbi:DUF1439 domain-containing protein [Paraglaciecola agarilytica]|uniref:DUF1439 domain-containing protein n=1 Tax=Paraglaciecola chathamensis TaxID=368405 RepID=UPI001C0933C5|nr:DUF1439 domain-containing protein [Paraglaciecola agarilytica]MBU3018541.1 DUF1439 domain-containing protein [Paraglaciecola agarilytica]
MKYLIGFIWLMSISQAFAFTKEFTEAELQEMVSAIMPITRSKFFVTMTLSEPRLDLLESSNEIGLGANIKASALGSYGGSGSGYLTGSLSYNQEQGALYFVNAKLLELNLNNVSAEQQEDIKKLLQPVVGTILGSRPIYVLDDSDLKQKLAKASLESLEVRDGKLIITLSAF